MLFRVWNSLSLKERTYYEAWSSWRTFKKTLPPWRFFGQKKIMRDHILMIEQFERMYILRKVRRQKKENEERNNNNNNNYGGHGTSGYRPHFQGRNSNVVSVL